MSSRITPVFIFSLPRSGSTLLQRIIAAHPDVETVAEPWLLLAPVYALRSSGVRAEYSHATLSHAIRDFCDQLQNGKKDYLDALRMWVLDLYQRASKGQPRYFVDKTPRYSLIVDEIIEAFPEGKFIFLWRNPLAVSASMIETWGGGRWNLYKFEVDLYDGLANLTEASVVYKERSITSRYEELVSDPEGQVKRVFGFLGLNGTREAIARFNDVRFDGRMGDPTGPMKFHGISSGSLDAWKSTLRNPVRKAWARRYLRWIGKDRLNVMGYDLQDLQASIEATPLAIRRVPSDIARIGYCALHRRISDRIVRT